jgi:addiction module HigA family antidote
MLFLSIIRTITKEPTMTSMHNPVHPGLVLRDYLGDLSITTVAERLGVTRAALSRILNGHAGISADMAVLLGAALGTSAEMWSIMQARYDLWQAQQKPHRQIQVFPELAHAA